MLQMRRSEIEAFARQRHLSWVEDSSNATNKYTRNFFRNELLPQLRSVFPQVEENLLNNIKRMQATNILYRHMAENLKKKVCEQKGDEVHMPVLKLLQYRHTSLIYEIIRGYGFNERAVEELIKLADAPSGKYIASEHFRIIQHRAWFIIAPIAPTAQTVVIEKGDTSVRFDSYQLQLKEVNPQKLTIDPSPATAQLDAKELHFPLILRKWKRGDYFYPLGMRKKKKLARFFIDNKLSQTQKEKVWVLESHKRIVWIAGHRIDDRFKITPSTKEVLQISLSSF
jgi:tRNA(Ile)-lysidine synthase